MTEQTEGPGQVLRAERESLGVTTRDVAETLNLSITMVEAIEADDYERMPAAVFARGYIRAYARLLDLDPEPIVARYPESAAARDAQQHGESAALGERLRRHPQLVVAGLVLLALLLMVLIGVWLWPADEPARSGGVDGSESVAPDDASGLPPAAMVEEAPVAEPAALQPVAPAEPEPEPLAEAAAEMADADTGPAEVAAAEPQTGAEQSGSSSAAAVVGAARRITQSGDDELRFEFTEDCWVEVKSGSGRSLYSDLSRAGSSLALVGEGPFRILLGYAPGATVAFNGEQVPLAPHTRNNVASLVLGQ